VKGYDGLRQKGEQAVGGGIVVQGGKVNGRFHSISIGTIAALYLIMESMQGEWESCAEGRRGCVVMTGFWLWGGLNRCQTEEEGTVFAGRRGLQERGAGGYKYKKAV